MKITIFLFIAIFVYVDADVYTITVEELTPQNEQVLSIANANDLGNSDANKTCLYNLVIRESIPDSPFYDGYATYTGAGITKVVQLCNTDTTDVSGTMSSILLSALGLQISDEIACPIEEKEACIEKEFKMVTGNFEGVFDDSNDETLEIRLPALIVGKFSISRKEGLPVPETVTDSSDKEKNEMEEGIKEAEAEEEAAGEQQDAEEEPAAADDGE